jgi:hypothetical protein
MQNREDDVETLRPQGDRFQVHEPMAGRLRQNGDLVVVRGDGPELLLGSIETLERVGSSKPSTSLGDRYRDHLVTSRVEGTYDRYGRPEGYLVLARSASVDHTDP